MITNAEYAKLASAVYKDKGAPDGWVRIANADPNPACCDGAASISISRRRRFNE